MNKETAVIAAPCGEGTIILHKCGSEFHAFLDHPKKGMVQLSPEFIHRRRYLLEWIFDNAQKTLDTIGLEVTLYAV